MATNDLHKNSWSADQMQARGFDTTFEVPATEMLGYDSSGNAVRRVAVNSDGELKVNLETADIEIGAVELKDGTTDARAPISATDGVLVDLGTNNDVTVTGSVTANAGTNLNTSTLALETGGNLATIAGKDFATQTTLAAINAKLVTGTDIGDVTINNGSGANAVNIQDGGNTITVDGTVTVIQATATNLKSQAENYQGGTAVGAANPLQVTLANTGANATAVKVDNSAVTQPVSGTVTANQGTAHATEKWRTSVIDALPAGTNAIGKLAANSGVDIGDVDVTSVVPGTGATNLGKAEDGAHSSGDVGVMVLGVRTDTPNTAISGTNGDYTPIATTSTGVVQVINADEDFSALANSSKVKKYYTNAGAVTDGIIWSPAAGKRWYVTDIFIQVSAAATVTLEDDLAAGDSAVWKAELAANSGWSHSFKTPLFSGEDAADLIITTTAGNVYVTVTGYEI